MFDTGRTNTVCTKYEIIEEAGQGRPFNQDFYHLHDVVFKKALDLLVKEGKAVLFSHEGEVGVKFVGQA